MEKFIKKNLSLIISIFILSLPIIDLITGLCLHLLNINFTFGIIIKILYLLFIMIISISYKKKVLIPLITIFIYSILYLLGIILYKDISLIPNIQSLIKTFYFPILLISLYPLKDEIKVSKLVLFTTMFLYMILIFVPLILGVGYKTYQITKAGTLGFYNSANEISGIISILTPIMFILFKDIKSAILKTILTLIYLVVILMIGTKTPLLSLFITIGFTILYLWYKSLKKKNYKPILYSFLGLTVAIILLIIVIPKTNFYKNIETHLNYLKVDNIVEVFEEEELVDHFIFSQRLTFLKHKASLYNKANIYQKLFGIGYLNDFDKETKLIEMDYFDIFYSHGLIGFLIYFIPILIIIYKIISPSKKLNYDRFMLNVSFLLIVFLSFFTGHIITAPSVALISVILILLLQKRKKRDLLFASRDLEMGGIESAQVSILNNINYNKYNVVLYLENKKGINLDRLNENVIVRELKVSNFKIGIIRKIINFIRKFNFRLFNFYNYDFSCCYTTYSLSSNKIAKIASRNNSIYVHSNYNYVYETKEEVLDFFNTRKVNEYRKILFVSNEAAHDFIKLYPDLKNKVKVYNNFIDIDRIIYLSKELIDEEKPKNKKLFVFIGRLEDNSKKLGRALNLVKEIKDIELWVIGDGKDREMYEEKVKELKITSRVKFLGSKSNPYPYIDISDYVILTSNYEGFPVVYLEAIVLDKPIITTINTSDDTINMEEYAYIISKDEKEEVEQVKEILNKNKRKKKYDLKTIQEDRMLSLEKIFNEVI